MGRRPEQRELLRALMEREPVPPGYCEAKVRTAATALHRKRCRTVARNWPRLAAALGDQFGPLFAAFAATNLPPQDYSALADGWAFAQFLKRKALLPNDGVLAMLRVELGYAANRNGWRCRRWPSLRLGLLRNPLRLILAVRLPWLGESWLRLRLS